MSGSGSGIGSSGRAFVVVLWVMKGNVSAFSHHVCVSLIFAISRFELVFGKQRSYQ